MDERLEKYRKGELSAEEAAKLEAELAKFEAFYEYMQEEVKGEDLFGDEAEPMTDSGALKKTIRRRWVKMALTIGAVVLAITGLALWSVPKIIDGMYYDPTKSSLTEEVSDYELYRIVDSQISAGQDPVNFVEARRTGPGQYQITESSYNTFSGNMANASMVLERNQLKDHSYTGQRANYNVPLSATAYTNYDSEGKRQQDEELSKLPASSWLSLDFIFNAPQSWQEIQKVVSENPEVQALAAELATDQSTTADSSLKLWEIKLALDSRYVGSFSYSNNAMEMIDQKYPMLLQNKQIDIDSSEADVKKFFASSLQYLIDHREDDLQEVQQKQWQEEFYGENSSSDHIYIPELFNEKAQEKLLKNLDKKEMSFTTLRLAVPKEQLSALQKSLPDSTMVIRDISLISLNLQQNTPW